MIGRIAEEEAATPKSAHIERERRWLVEPGFCPLPSDFVLIEDRYIEGTRLRLRRMTDSASGRIVLKLTKKYDTPDPASRPIVTAYLDESEFAMFERLPARLLLKRRFAVGGFSVDVFVDRPDLPVIAEIEAASAYALAAVKPPPWAMHEITHDGAMQGGSLASVS